MVTNSNNINKTKATSHINLHNTKIPYDVGIPGSSLGHAHKCGGFKSVNRIPTLPSTALNTRGAKNELSHVECFRVLMLKGIKYSGGLGVFVCLSAPCVLCAHCFQFLWMVHYWLLLSCFSNVYVSIDWISKDIQWSIKLVRSKIKH